MTTTQPTQNLIYSVRVLKGASTRQHKNILNCCQEIIERPIYDPDDMTSIKEYRQLYEAAV